MDNLFVTKVVKIQNIKMPQDYARWMDFIKDRFYSEHPYVPQTEDLNTIIENMDAGAQTAVGYIKIVIGGQGFYVPLIIDKGSLYPFDLIIGPDGKAFGFIKEFYDSAASKRRQVFGKAVKDKKPNRMQTVYNNSPQIMKKANKEIGEDDLKYVLIKRAAFNKYQITAVYGDNSTDTFNGAYSTIERLNAQDLMKTASVGDERIMLPYVTGKIMSFVKKASDDVAISYNTPGTYRVLNPDPAKTEVVDDTVTGILLKAPLHKSSGKEMVFIAPTFYSFVNEVKGFKVSNKINIDKIWITNSGNLEDIVPLEEGTLKSDGPIYDALYVYDNGGYYGLLISAVVSALHNNEGTSYYKVRLATGEKVGLVCDPNILPGTLTDISTDEAARGVFLKGVQTVYQIGASFLKIINRRIETDFTKKASYQGTRCAFSIKGEDYMFSSGNMRASGKENIVKTAMADFGITEPMYQRLKTKSNGKYTEFILEDSDEQ